MSQKPYTAMSVVLFVVALAAVGYGVIVLPPYVADQYDHVARQSPVLGYAYLAAVGLVGLVVAGVGGWAGYRLWRNTRDKHLKRAQDDLPPSRMTEAQKEQAITAKMAEVESLVQTAPIPVEEKKPLTDAAKQLATKRTAQTLEIVAFGTISSGKSSLLNALAGRDVFRTDAKGGTTVTRGEVTWTGDDKVVLVDTPGLGEVGGADRERLARDEARNADLILFVLDGALKDFEFRVIKQLAELEKPIVVCLNKQDWYGDRDREVLLGQIAGQLRGQVKAEDLLAVRSRGASRTRVRVLSDGSEHEEAVAVEPDIGPLAERLMTILRRDRRELLLANLLLRSRALLADTRDRIRASLDRKAEEIVRRHTWQAGGAAALSPLPVLDVIAAVAINSKMVFEIAAVYQVKLDLAVAERLVGELGKSLIGVLGANVATPAVSTVIASALKTVPGVGTVAGGVLQGLTQAVLTYWTGRVFVTYFANEMKEPAGGLAELARKQWAEVTSPAKLAELAKLGLDQLNRKETP